MCTSGTSNESNVYRQLAVTQWRPDDVPRPPPLPTPAACFFLKLAPLSHASTSTHRALSPLSSDYEVLGLSRLATTEEVKQSYRKLALKWHPDRSSEPKAIVLAKFDAIAEAYEVLSNPSRRAIFDQFGESGLKDGIPDGKGGVKGGKYQFNNNAAAIFEKFFGTSR